MEQLNIQVQQAAKDKAFFEDEFSATSLALNKLHEHMKSMSLKLESSEETIKAREKELMELGIVQNNMETSFINEQNKAACLIEEKGGIIKQLEEDVASKKMALEGLTSKTEKLQLEMSLKEHDLLQLRMSKAKLESINEDLLSSKDDFSNRLEIALMEIKNLEVFVKVLVGKFKELENQSLTFSDKVIQLNVSFDSCLKLAQLEKDLVSKAAQRKFDQIQDQWASVVSEKNALQLVNQKLNNKVLELQKEQEFAMVQHAEEGRLAEARIRKLESEAEGLVSRQTELQALILKLEDNLRSSSENSRLSNEQMKNLSLKLSELEKENKGIMNGLNADILKKQEEINLLQMEVDKGEKNVNSLEKRISDLENALKEKGQLLMELKTREKQLDDHKAEVMASLADTESKLQEAKKQYDLMLESKHLELSKHLKEISQRNDQAINDVRRKYEVEKQEIVNLEKEKADKMFQDLENKCETKIEEYRKESEQHLLQAKEEHAAVISKMQQEYANKERSLISKHTEELKRTELHAETELREHTKLLRSEYEAELRDLRREREDEFRRLQEELDVQKAKEERQRALLQLQWKVMSDDPQEEQEVTSKKNYSISSAKKRNKDRSKRTHRPLDRPEVEEKDSPYRQETQTPVSHLVKKVENANNMPNHRKVTHHEYEIETPNGRTITKRKTKSRVMFGEPRKHRKRETPKAAIQGVKNGGHPNPSNIGDLFTEGSLNPYADDPYAFG